MASQGSLVCQVYTSNAVIPVENATVSISQKSPTGTILLTAVRITDRSGRTAPVAIDTPPLETSTAPDQEKSWTAVDITVDHPGYDRAIVENVQIFPQTNTLQQLELIPLSENANNWDQTQIFVVPPQNL